jgi:predicted dehydrogenase
MKVCFYGLGSIGKKHLINLTYLLSQRGESYEIDALRSTDRMFDDHYASLISHQFTDISQLADDYDIAFITNPTAFHYDAIKAMFKKARHLFIEKPLFESTAYDVQEIMPEQGRIFYVACPLRHSQVIKYISENVVGKYDIYSLRAICSSYLPDWRKGVDYRTVYSAEKKLGGGASVDLIHEWDYITGLFGNPKKVYNINNKYSNLEINSDDISVYIADYGDKTVELHLDYFGREPRREIELFTQKGTITGDFIEKEIRSTFVETLILPSKDMYISEMEYFLDAINGIGGNINDLTAAYNTIKIANSEWNI